MTELTDDRVKEIATGVARDNKVNVSYVLTGQTTVASTGALAFEVKLVLPPGTTSAVIGLPSARLIKALADAGEERLPIVRYDEEPSVASRS
jgi:hypothetical protein